MRASEVDSAPSPDDMLRWRDRVNAMWGIDAQDSWEYRQSSLDLQQREEERLYFQHFDIEAPMGKLGVRSGSAPSDADAAIDSLVPADMLIRCKPARGKKKYKEQADKLSKYGKAIFAAWRKKRDEVRDVVSNMVIRRVGIARILYDETLWPVLPEDFETYPERGEDESDEGFAARVEKWEDKEELWLVRNRRKYPIIFESRDPRTTRWVDSNGDLLVVVEDYWTSALEAWSALGHYSEADSILDAKQPEDRVHVSDVWMGRYRAIFIDDRPIFPGDVLPHGYLEIPYIIFPFRELPFQSPHHRYRGMLTNSANLYQIESQVLTMNVHMLANNAWRTFVGWTRDGRDLVIVPGTLVPIDKQKGEYLEILEGKPVPPELMAMATTIDGYIQRNGVSQGPKTAEGTRSGQQLWAIQAMRQLKIESPKQSLKRGLERALYLAAQIHELMVQETITLPIPGRERDGTDSGEVMVGPVDISGYWDGWDITFSRRLDPALLEQMKALMTASTNKWMPRQVSHEFSGLTDSPEEWKEELMIQATEELPFMIEMIALERAKNWWGEDSWEYQTLRAKVEQSQAQQAPGGQAQPQGGGLTAPSMKGPVETSPGAALSQGMQAGKSGRSKGAQRKSPPQYGGGGRTG